MISGPGRIACRLAAALPALFHAIGTEAQVLPPSPQPQTLRFVNEDIAYSLFLLTNGGFTSAGHIDYRDENLASRIQVYTLPVRVPVPESPIGPLELRLTGGYGEATTTQIAAGTNGSSATERQFLALWNWRLDVGRPVTLAPGLVFTPMLGLGTQHWTGKFDRSAPAGSAAPGERTNFWTDALLTEAAALLEYRYAWGEVNIRPGASASFVRLSSVDGRATLLPPPPAPAARGKAAIDADSTVLRAALRVDGPLHLRLGATELRWQSFVVGNYSTASIGLFPWSVELGLALGAELGALGRSLIGFDPGEFYVGASYITGENFSGVRANFGFKF